MKTLKQYIYKSILGFLALILCEVTNAQNIRLEIWPGTICSGQSATINVDFYSSFISDPPITYYFYKNGNQYTYINSSELYFEYQMPNVSQGDQIRCEVVTNGSNRYVSNTFTVQIFQPITPYVYISTYAELDDYTNQPVFCPNTNKTMVADGNGSSYQWFRNGSSVSTSRTYTPATLNNGDVIRVETKIYDQCRGIYRTASDQITADVRPDITPTATLTSNAGANICAGTSVTFTASATGVQYMSYSWLKNGQPIPGVYSSTYMATDLVNGDQIQAQVSSYESCVTQTTTQSNTLTMQIQTPQPLTVSLIGDTQVCNWDDISVYANVSIPYNQINSIEWYYNGENDTHYNVSTDPLYFKLRPGSAWENTSTVKCRITPKSGVCLTNSEVYSSDFVITLKPTEYNYVSIYSTDSEREWREGGTINEICRGGQSVTFAATALPANYNHTYTWYLNNYELPNSNKTTMTITEEMLNGYGAESVSQVKASIVTTGGCLRNIYKGSGTISLKLVNSPSAPSVTPEVSQGCMHAVLTAKLPPNQAAYWQTSATGESFINYGGSPYLVSQPGVYHLRSYGACWGAAKSVTVVANDMDGAKPMLSVQYTCNKAILKLENTLSGLTYYFQTSADSKLTTEPFTNIVSQSKTAYYVRGTDGNSWGCTSNPLAVNIVAGVNCDKNYIRERVVQNQGITSGTQITATNALTNYTYYDGLGRPEQSVAAASSPLGFDMVTPMEYDTYGRQSKQYLPYIASTVNGSYQDTAVSAQGNYYKATHVNTVKDDNPWSDTDF